MEKEKRRTYYSAAKNIASNKYVKAHQTTIPIRWKNEYVEQRLRPAVNRLGMPTATFIKEAVEEKIRRMEGAEKR